MNRDLTIVAIALMVWGLGEGMFLFFQPLYLEELGASPIQIGTILGIVGIAMTVAHIPVGYLSDRFGRRPMMYTAWFLGTSAAWIMALAQTLPLFVIGSALYGLTSFVVVPLNSYITAARGKMSVGRVITLIGATFSLGAIVGPILGGWIGDHQGLRFSFLIAALFFMSSTFLILFIRPQPVEKTIHSFKFSLVAGLKSKLYVQYLIIIFIVMFSLYLPQPLSQNFLQNERGINLTQMGLLISSRSVGIVVLNLVLGQLSAGAGFLFAQVGMALFSILIWLGTGFPWYVMGYFLLGSYQTARSLATAQGRELLAASNMGLGYGLIETVMSLAIILAPPLAGLLYSYNPTLIYSVSLILIFAGIIIFFFFSPIKRAQGKLEKP
jgi:MFS family permease